MSKVLLVHGSCHGAWCFRDVIPALAALGHQAHAIDLPGHGDNPAPIEKITLDAYRDAILDAIDEPVYLWAILWPDIRFRPQQAIHQTKSNG